MILNRLNNVSVIHAWNILRLTSVFLFFSFFPPFLLSLLPPVLPCPPPPTNSKHKIFSVIRYRAEQFGIHILFSNVNIFFSFGVLFLETHPYSFHIVLLKDHHFPVIVKFGRKHFSKSFEGTLASVNGHHSHKSPFFQLRLKDIKKRGPISTAEGAQNMPLKIINSFPIITYVQPG